MNDQVGSKQMYYQQLAQLLVAEVGGGWSEVILEADFKSDGEKKARLLRDGNIVTVPIQKTMDIFLVLNKLREAVKKDEMNKFKYCKFLVTSTGSFNISFDYDNNHL